MPPADPRVAFLTRCIAEDEAAATRILSSAAQMGATRMRVLAVTEDSSSLILGDYDPARVLREVEAKRELLELASEAMYSADHYAWHGIEKALLSVYSDRDGYDPAWSER